MDDHRNAGVNVKVYNVDPVPGEDRLTEEVEAAHTSEHTVEIVSAPYKTEE